MKAIDMFKQIISDLILLSGMIFSGVDNNVFAAANIDGYDTTRIFHAMDRARRGEDITIAVVGGSITAGNLASSTETRFTNLMTDWWIETFPTSNITLINAGLGGTGSDLGTFRLYRDVLSYNPDFIVVEFSVNDSEGEYAEKMMEGLIRQALMYDSLPGVMMLILKQQSGVSAQASHKPVGNHYNVPIVSFADSIDSRVAEDGHTLGDIFVDGLHPNDLGMQYIADFLIEELELIYNALPAEGSLPPITETLPDPLITDVYAHPYLYSTSTIVPVSNTGWSTGSTKWSAETEGSEITFEVDGNAVSFIYTRHNIGTRGQVEAWVDDGPHQTFDAYWTETWGPAFRLALVQENLPDGNHILHARVNGENTSGSDGHYFEITNVCKAGNFEGVAPIAKAGPNYKVVINTSVPLDGSESFDPEGDSIQSYEWTVASSPEGSIATIVDPGSQLTEFTPDIEGIYKINLVVSDGIYNSVAGVMKITAKATNTAPIANAGNDTTVATSKFFLLNGTASSDPDGDLLLYSWELISKPGEGPLNMNFLNTPHPRIFPPLAGEYVFGLVVNDSITSSEEDFVTVTAVDGYLGTTGIESYNFVFNVHPNPTTGIISIEYEIPSNQNISIALYTISGNMIADITDGEQNQGNQSIEVDLTGYSRGIYVIKMICEKELFASRIVKIE
jgi:lysophospholipase L1-like esterase